MKTLTDKQAIEKIVGLFGPQTIAVNVPMDSELAPFVRTAKVRFALVSKGIWMTFHSDYTLSLRRISGKPSTLTK